VKVKDVTLFGLCAYINFCGEYNRRKNECQDQGDNEEY